MKIRLKFGKNPYSNLFTCSFCRREFDAGGFFLRLEHDGNIIDAPVCRDCFESGDSYEAMIDLSAHNAAHPIKRA